MTGIRMTIVNFYESNKKRCFGTVTECDKHLRKAVGTATDT